MAILREVWDHNVAQELDRISRLAASPDRNYICIDTEFPGFLRDTPVHATEAQRYEDMKYTVDNTRIVQLGLTLFFERDDSCGYSWQVNFRGFDPAVDSHKTSSVELLKRSGIDFERNGREGVDAAWFSRLAWRKLFFPRRNRTSWITFHGLYDLGYIVKLLTGGVPLPSTPAEFVCVVRRLFGRGVYDVKCIAMAKSRELSPRLGLVAVAKVLGIEWKGRSHQAGHDSRLIGSVFRRLKERFCVDEDQSEGILYGLEQSSSQILLESGTTYCSSCGKQRRR